MFPFEKGQASEMFKMRMHTRYDEYLCNPGREDNLKVFIVNVNRPKHIKQKPAMWADE